MGVRTPRVKATRPALTWPGGAPARGARLSAPGLGGWGVPSNFSQGFFRFICLQTCKIHRNSCITPKNMKLVLLDSASLDLLKKNIVVHVTLL